MPIKGYPRRWVASRKLQIPKLSSLLEAPHTSTQSISTTVPNPEEPVKSQLRPVDDTENPQNPQHSPREKVKDHYFLRPFVKLKAAGGFYRQHPTVETTTKNALFKGLPFLIEGRPHEDYKTANPGHTPKIWAVIGPVGSGKSTFLNILRGGGVSIPADKRRWPWFEKAGQDPEKGIAIVGFDGERGGLGGCDGGGSGPTTAYLSARYESRRESTDWSLLDYLKGQTELNPSHEDIGIGGKPVDEEVLASVLKHLRLEELVDMPVGNLSNGQTRRARIARALVREPKLLLLDEPWTGLDPKTVLELSPLLGEMAKAQKPSLLLTLRPQDPIPVWITHLLYLRGNCSYFLPKTKFYGEKFDVLSNIKSYFKAVVEGKEEEDPSLPVHSFRETGKVLKADHIVNQFQRLAIGVSYMNSSRKGKWAESHSRDGFPLTALSTRPKEDLETLIEFQGAMVQYGDKPIVGNWTFRPDEAKASGIWWQIKRGERWGIFGPNGSGKTTLLSLICSDHPQTYSQPIKLFGKSRLPEPGKPGISIFDIQRRIGHSSPEVHAHIPRHLTLMQVIRNAYADTFLGKPEIDEEARLRIEACLQWFKAEFDLAYKARSSNQNTILNSTETHWAEELTFGELPYPAQKVALFLRAIIKAPDLVILDEAFSGMDDKTRDKCMTFLGHGETMPWDQEKGTPDPVLEVLGDGNQPSESANIPKVTVEGLNDSQALLCVSHVQEEVPGVVREWICLPDPKTDKPMEMGRLKCPLQGVESGWERIWGTRIEFPRFVAPTGWLGASTELGTHNDDGGKLAKKKRPQPNVAKGLAMQNQEKAIDLPKKLRIIKIPTETSQQQKGHKQPLVKKKASKTSLGPFL